MNVNRRHLVVATVIATLGSRAGARDTDAQSADNDAMALLATAADQMRTLNSVRWKLDYMEGSTTIFGRVSLNKGEGAYTRPNLLSAEAEAKVGFLGIDVHAVSNSETVWVDAVGFDRTINPGPSLSSILADPLAVIGDILMAVEAAAIAGTVEIEGETLTTIAGVFNPELIENPALLDYLEIEAPQPVEVIINSAGLVVSAQQTGPVVGYDSDNVSRKVSFSDYNAEIIIETPE